MAKKDKSKNNFGWSYIILGVIIVAFVLFVFLDKNEPDNQVRTDIDSEVKFLTRCLEIKDVPIEERDGEMKTCPNVSEKDLDKLIMLTGLSEEVVCDSIGKNDSEQTYRECFQYVRGCTQVFQLIDSIGDGADKKFYQVFECKQTQTNYYVFYHIVPPEIKVVKIPLTQETIDKLK